MKIEVVTYNLESVRIAERAGASRVELCSNEGAGGTSPSLALLQLIKATLDIPVFCMVRPREGDFTYSSEELKIMELEIKYLKNAGADGIVSAVLNSDGSVNTKILETLVLASSPLPFTFHRAFDHVSDPLDSLHKIIESGCRRILTSGLKKTAEEGIPMIKELIEIAGEKIIILPGSGINPGNVKKIILETGCREIHLSAKKMIQRDSFLNKEIQLGSAADNNSYQVTDEKLLSEVLLNSRF